MPGICYYYDAAVVLQYELDTRHDTILSYPRGPLLDDQTWKFANLAFLQQTVVQLRIAFLKLQLSMSDVMVPLTDGGTAGGCFCPTADCPRLTIWTTLFIARAP